MEENIYVDIIKGYEQGNRYAHFRQQYDKSLVKKADGYSLSVDRFNIPMTSIPIFIFNHAYEIRDSAVYYNNYLVSMSYNGVYTDPHGVQYISGSDNLTDLTSDPDTTNPQYYYVWNVAVFLRMINKALSAAFAELSSLLALPSGASEPFFTINYSTNTLIYYAQRKFYDTDTLALPICVYINNNLWNMLKGFNFLIIGGLITSAANKRDAQLLCFNQYNNLITYGGTADTNYYYVMICEFGAETLISWNVAKGFFITTGNLPIRNEFAPSIQGVYDKNTQEFKYISNNAAVSLPIMCSFDFIYASDTPFPLSAQYILSSPYKNIDLIDPSPINNIDLSVFWFDKYNNVYPLKFYREEAMTIRLLFRKIINKN